MKKAIIALVAMATIVIASIGNADAQYYRRGPSGGAVAAGVIGGLAAGAIIGGAIASSRPAYAYPAYSEPVYVAPPRMCLVDQEFWSERRQTYVIRRVRVAC
jgi:hypothetical protein